MGVILYLYPVKDYKHDEFDDFLMGNHSAEEMNSWLKKNSELENAYVPISYREYKEEVTEFLNENDEVVHENNNYKYFKINKTTQSKEKFFDLYWIKESWLKTSGVWKSGTFLIICAES